MLVAPNRPLFLKKRRALKIHNSLEQRRRQSACLFPGLNFCYNPLYEILRTFLCAVMDPNPEQKGYSKRGFLMEHVSDCVFLRFSKAHGLWTVPPRG